MVTTPVRPPAQQFGPVPRHFWASGLDLFDVLGQIVLFSVAALCSSPRALRYRHEIWWYAAFLALGSTPVALVMTYFSGSECSVEAYYSLHQLGGAESLAGVFNALCDMREITPLFFGFAIGAKVGCGLVAELGTMRINEEIDALETMGVPSVPFLVTTRRSRFTSTSAKESVVCGSLGDRRSTARMRASSSRVPNGFTT